ncbi:MAG: CocE/NonD family hydrolase [Promethearchaeota archaeon]
MEINKTKKLLATLFILTFAGIIINIIPTVRADPNGPIFMEAMVPMSDSTELYTKIYLPGPGAYPIILTRTPYGIGAPTWDGGIPPDPADLSQWPHEILNGYGRIHQDTRGRYYSEGVDRLFYDDGDDGYDMIEWIVSQPWCNGKVGMTGGSATGITTYLAAGANHPNLMAAISYVASANLYNDLTFDGGAFRADSNIWTHGQTIGGLSMSHMFSVAPPSDWATHLTNIGYNLYDMATHTSLVPGYRAVDSLSWMNLPLVGGEPSFSIMQPFGDEILRHPSQDAFRDKLNVQDTINIPVLHVGGWFDFFSRCSVDAFVNLQHLGNQKLFVLPGTHGGLGTMPYDPYYKWFDYWLKDVDTGIMDEPPVWYYGLGDDEWRWADQWPPGNIEYTPYYMHDNGDLDVSPSGESEDSISYVYDPMDPVLTWGGRNLGLPAGSRDQTPAVLGRDDIISYTSSELTEDIEIAGPIKVFLSASSNCTDTDFTAKLIDVLPTGELMLVGDGIIRARYRNSMAIPELMSGNPGDVYEFTISMGDICQVFKAGHKIRVDISSSNFPKHDRNLNTGGVLYQETDMFNAENTIYHDDVNPSYIVLPVVSAKPTVFDGTVRSRYLDLPYEGPSEMHIYENAIYLHFDDTWIKYDISRVNSYSWYETYICYGDHGRIDVFLYRFGNVWRVMAGGYRINFWGSA